MKCINCGNEIPDNVKFCTACGAPQQSQAQQPAQATQQQNQQQSSAYTNNNAYQYNSPALQLNTGRGLAKLFFLSLITLGIYGFVVYCKISGEINIAASRYDGKRTMHYLGMLMVTPITLGIYSLVWFSKFSSRIGEELARRNYDYKFGARDYWLWNILGALIIVGPFIYVHKLLKAMNMINASYNVYG